MPPLSAVGISDLQAGVDVKIWRERFFILMLHNAQSVTDFFRIPTNRLVELGTLSEI
jgi:K+ transporter